MTDFEMRGVLAESYEITTEVPWATLSPRVDVLVDAARDMAAAWARERGLELSDVRRVHEAHDEATMLVGVRWSLTIGTLRTDPQEWHPLFQEPWTWSARAKDWAHVLANVAKPVLRAVPDNVLDLFERSVHGRREEPRPDVEQPTGFTDMRLFENVRDAMADFDVDPGAHDDGSVTFSGGPLPEALAIYVGGPPMPNSLIGAPVEDAVLRHDPAAYGLPPRITQAMAPDIEPCTCPDYPGRAEVDPYCMSSEHLTATQSRLDTDGPTSCRPDTDPWL